MPNSPVDHSLLPCGSIFGSAEIGAGCFADFPFFGVESLELFYQERRINKRQGVERQAG